MKKMIPVFASVMAMSDGASLNLENLQLRNESNEVVLPENMLDSNDNDDSLLTTPTHSRYNSLQIHLDNDIQELGQHFGQTTGPATAPSGGREQQIHGKQKEDPVVDIGNHYDFDDGDLKTIYSDSETRKRTFEGANIPEKSLKRVKIPSLDQDIDYDKHEYNHEPHIIEIDFTDFGDNLDVNNKNCKLFLNDIDICQPLQPFVIINHNIDDDVDDFELFKQSSLLDEDRIFCVKDALDNGLLQLPDECFFSTPTPPPSPSLKKPTPSTPSTPSTSSLVTTSPTPTPPPSPTSNLSPLTIAITTLSSTTVQSSK